MHQLARHTSRKAHKLHTLPKPDKGRTGGRVRWFKVVRVRAHVLCCSAVWVEQIGSCEPWFCVRVEPYCTRKSQGQYCSHHARRKGGWNRARKRREKRGQIGYALREHGATIVRSTASAFTHVRFSASLCVVFAVINIGTLRTIDRVW